MQDERRSANSPEQELAQVKTQKSGKHRQLNYLFEKGSDMHSTAQHSTAQHSTAQHSTAFRKSVSKSSRSGNFISHTSFYCTSPVLEVSKPTPSALCVNSLPSRKRAECHVEKHMHPNEFP
jgi:hypothetical protein